MGLLRFSVGIFSLMFVAVFADKKYREKKAY